ncbi:MAG: hypothetical protein IMY86_13765 [Chloroflexi bacterium]|nr:hypothetical protein [Chloroflexota bacterium]
MMKRQPMDRWDRYVARRRATMDRLNDPKTADNMQVRKELLKRMDAGELTLAQVQAELKRIQREARKRGESTAYRP